MAALWSTCVTPWPNKAGPWIRRPKLLMYLTAIAAATRQIDLQAAYFVPDRLTINALLAAVKRGVRIRITVPGKHIDSLLVRIASKSQWGRMLALGVEIYEYMPTMLHSKLLIVDEEFVSVGSTNFDMRSFKLNDEASLNVYDRGLPLSCVRCMKLTCAAHAKSRCLCGSAARACNSWQKNW
jgi:phosphatidylserine/phosphatidylglycerophosphate/cardiolipin synthase-like enzyme